MNINLRQWMKDIDDNTNLFTITIPGTHDCVTQYVQFPHISKCQDLNIYEQLNIGIRALDIRVKSKGNKLGMIHGKANAFVTPNRFFGKKMEMADVLAHCYNFLSKNPSEAIVFQFKNDSNKEMEKCFNNLYYTYIKGNEDKWFLENRVPSLKEVRGKIVLLRRCKMDKSNKEFTDENTGLDFSRWVEQDVAIPDPLTLKTYSKDDSTFIIQDRFKYKPQERWEKCLFPFLEKMEKFDGTYIINYTSTAGGFLGPKCNSSIINSMLIDYPLDKNKYYGTIYLDFPYPDLTRKIISHNYQ